MIESVQHYRETLAPLIVSALDWLQEGLGVFDENLNLVYCNERFRCLRDYPDSVCRPGAHISELYRHNAARGDYGVCDVEAEVAQRVASAASRERREFDQTLTDGTILGLRYTPIPEGGLLFTYEHVTEKRRTEADLKESRQRSALVGETLTEGIYEWRIAEHEFHPSPRLEALFEFERDEWNPKEQDWNDRVHPEDFDRYRSALVPALKGDVPRYHCEYRIRNKHGAYIWILDQGVVAERDGDGRAIRFVGAILDIGDRKRAEEALRESQERYAYAVDAVNEGVYDWDIAADRIYFTDKVHEVLGLSPQQLTAPHDWTDRLHPDDLPEYRARLVEHFKGKTERFETECRYRRGDGSWGWARQHGIAFRDEGGRAYRMIGATGDITEYKEMALALEATQVRLVDAIESISSGFALFDAQDRIVLCNSVFKHYFPELEDMVEPGTPFRDIIEAAVGRGMFPSAEGREQAFIDELIKRRSHATGTREQHMASGLWLQISDHPTADGGLVSVYTNVTELKKRGAELLIAKEEAERALADLKLAQRNLVHAEKMASLGQLVAGIAHEIKNPLHFINNFARTSMELMDEILDVLHTNAKQADGDVSKDIVDTLDILKGDLKSIRSHGQRADSIVQGMLLHSRGDSGERRPTDLNALIQESLNLAYHGQRAAISGFNVALESQLDPRVKEIELVSQEITRVLVNLLGNAFYAVDKRRQLDGDAYEGVVTVSSAPLDDDRVEIRIRDNGRGMSNETLDKLFTPFFTTKPPGEGTGLGLSVSHDIVVEQHGGTIRADSEVGAFAEFVIELPCHGPGNRESE